MIKDELSHIDWEPFLGITPGILFRDIQSFEKTLSPIPKGLLDLFSGLGVFQGICLNFFRIEKGRDPHHINNPKHKWSIFPLSISANARKLTKFFQCDILVDGQHLRDTYHKSYNPPAPNHALCISSLNHLIERFNPLGLNRNVAKYPHICRSCFKSGTISQILAHQSVCNDRRRNPRTGRKKVTNTIIHRPFIVDRYTGKVQKNGLYFKKGNYHTMIKDAAMMVLDFECGQKHIDKADPPTNTLFESTPKKAIKTLPPLSYCYTSISLYEDINLPNELTTPRFKCVDSSNPSTGENDFFISLLLSMRKDLYLHHEHIRSIILRNKPPEPVHLRDPYLMSVYSAITHCNLCGSKFGSWRRSSK